MKGAALAILLSGGPALAEPLVDLPLLFSQNAEKVVVKDNGSTFYRELALGDGVVTRCTGDGFHDCVSIDTNDRGDATDCALVGAARILLLTRSCGIGGAASRFMLEGVMTELGQHVALNAVPPRDWMTLRKHVMDRAQKDRLPACAELDNSMRNYFARRLRLEDLVTLQAMASAPRLPVGKCLD